MIARVLPFVLLLGLSGAAHGQGGIPPHPETSEWIWDKAELVTTSDAAAIEEVQLRCGQSHSTALVVVTIPRMSDYATGLSIEDFARTWFDAWEIGARDYNTGILLLVSKEDRRARIELGALWGRKWDGYCQRVMDGEIVPRFKQKDFSGGIRAGVEALETMVALGPQASPPQPGFAEKLEQNETVRKLRATQPLPLWIANLCLVAGVGLCVLAIFLPKSRKWLLICGALLILTGITIYLLVIVFGAFSKGRGGSSSSGFGGGGFSGGGGASGSW